MKVNLKDYYPYYNDDFYVDVTLAVGKTMLDAKCSEAADERKKWRYRAIYSLDVENPRELEKEMIFLSLSTEQIFERKVSRQELYSAILSLPEIQRRRIYAFYFLRMNKSEIARKEGVAERNVRQAISKGLKNLEIILKNYF